jgi:hypothetical protein
MSKKDAETDEKRPDAGSVTAEFHLNALIARQHLSIDEIITANRVALDSLKNVWSRQCDMAAEAFRGLSIVISRSAEAGYEVDPQIFEYAERSRRVFEKSLVHTRELTDMTTAAMKELMVQTGRQAHKYMEALHPASGPDAN